MSSSFSEEHFKSADLSDIMTRITNLKRDCENLAADDLDTLPNLLSILEILDNLADNRNLLDGIRTRTKLKSFNSSHTPCYNQALEIVVAKIEEVIGQSKTQALFWGSILGVHNLYENRTITLEQAKPKVEKIVKMLDQKSCKRILCEPVPLQGMIAYETLVLLAHYANWQTPSGE